jgi:hypothetical protein
MIVNTHISAKTWTFTATSLKRAAAKYWNWHVEVDEFYCHWPMRATHSPASIPQMPCSILPVVQQDMSALQLNQKFRLAFIALGSFAHVTARPQQQRALASIRAHLSPGGTFIIDISNTDARYLEDLGGQMLHQGTWQREDGTYLTHFLSPAASPERHLLELTHFYEQYRQGGTVQRSVVTTHLYLFERAEMELLLEQAGFLVKDVYGDYDLSPYHLESPRMICIAEAAR